MFANSKKVTTFAPAIEREILDKKDGPDQPEDEVCRPIAAEDLLRRHALMERQLCPQLPAQGVGVAVRRGQCRRPFPSTNTVQPSV